MSGVLTSLGIVSVAAAVPGVAKLLGLLEAAQAAAKVEILGKLKGLANVTAALTIPPLPTVTVAAAGKVALQLALNPQIAAPSLQLAANASVVAELNAKLALLVPPPINLGAAGVAVYRYEGTINELGSKLAAATSGGLPGGTGNDFAYATIMVTTSPAAAVALAEVLL